MQIPKLRQGSYFPSFLQPRRRSEQALVAVVQQAYVCGVSTRRVDQLVESLGLSSCPHRPLPPPIRRTVRSPTMMSAAVAGTFPRPVPSDQLLHQH